MENYVFIVVKRSAIATPFILEPKAFINFHLPPSQMLIKDPESMPPVILHIARVEMDSVLENLAKAVMSSNLIIIATKFYLWRWLFVNAGVTINSWCNMWVNPLIGFVMGDDSVIKLLFEISSNLIYHVLSLFTQKHIDAVYSIHNNLPLLKKFLLMLTQQVTNTLLFRFIRLLLFRWF